MSWDAEFDFVSVGAGSGGLTAAVTAAEAGAQALVVEKGASLGGVTAFSLGQVWIGGSHLERELGIDDSATETIQYLDFLSTGLRDVEVQRAFVDRSDDVLRFLNDKADLALGVIRGLPDYYYPFAPGSKAEGRYLEVEPFPLAELGELEPLAAISPHGYGYFGTAESLAARGDFALLSQTIAGHMARREVCGGTACMARLLKAASDLGVTFWTESPAVRLISDGDGIVGVEVRRDGRSARVRTPAVLLATGGYDWNPQFVQAFEHLNELESWAPTTIEGDHLVMAGELGAMVSTSPTFTTPLIPGFQVPGEQWEDGRPFFRGLFAGAPHTIMVNRAGRRFADESFFHDIDAQVGRFDGHAGEFPNRPSWYVFDQVFREKYPVGTVMPGEPLPDGLAFTANTIRELAKQAGLDADNLEQTVAHFNRACAEGVDHDFGRGTMPWSIASWGDARVTPNPLLGSIDKPPFHAIKLSRIASSIPSAGLRTNATGSVLNARGEVIGGLYAAGNAAARLDTGGYQSGTANARGMTFGYLAALDAISRPGAVHQPAVSGAVGQET